MNSFDDFLSLRREMESRYPSLSTTGSYRIERSDRDFWSFYHAHKDALRQAKLYVVKTQAAGRWWHTLSMTQRLANVRNSPRSYHSGKTGFSRAVFPSFRRC